MGAIPMVVMGQQQPCLIKDKLAHPYQLYLKRRTRFQTSRHLPFDIACLFGGGDIQYRKGWPVHHRKHMGKNSDKFLPAAQNIKGIGKDNLFTKSCLQLVKSIRRQGSKQTGIIFGKGVKFYLCLPMVRWRVLVRLMICKFCHQL